MSQTALQNGQQEAVIRKALFRAGDALSLSGADLAAILHCSESSVSRSRNRERPFDDAQEEFIALFLRLYRSLDAMVGPSQENMRRWFKAYNDHLSGIPEEMVQSVEGLVHVVGYLDAMRGKI